MDTQKREIGHLSYTKINMYRRCPRQYEFRYEHGIKEPPALRPSAGKAGHAGIEAHMRRKMETGEDPPVAIMLDAFDTSWNRETLDLIPEEGENPGKTKDATYYTLQHYHAAEAPGIQPKAIEQEFMLPITVADQVLPPIKGYIDIIQTPVDGPPTLDIEDTKFKFPGKTGRVYPKTQADADWSIQLDIYDMALQHAGIRVDRLGLGSIIGPVFKNDDPIPAKDPDIQHVWRDERLMQPAIRDAMTERTRRVILAVYNAIQSGNFIPTDNPRTCSWCGYRKICPDSLAKDDFIAQILREETPA